ncbi:MAG TPA: helix-turn-helix transcriptional regulator [Streptosporangiaceae bacterium]|jgi:AraC-like DNA-binding protein|nr:helix-turn-helix transcriptional regulator [Streptosporangiaceae bacterium]
MPADTIELTTNDPDLARDKLSELYSTIHPISYFGDGSDFEFKLRAMQAGELHGGCFRHTMPTRAEIAPFRQFLTATVLAGQMRWDSGGEQVSFRRGQVLRCPTVTSSDTSWSDLTVAVVGVPLEAIEQAAQAHTGMDPADLRFHTLTPVSPAMARRWRALTGFVHRMLSVDGAMLDSPLIRAHLTDMIAVTALTVFPNSTMTAEHTAGAGRMAPAALRRAVAYLDHHADQPVTLAAVAEAAGVTPRALQAAFRQHYSTTPMSYLRRVRLEGAHRELQTAGSGQESVTAVAYRWGFSSPSRFAAYYRGAYGVLPSRTLRD